MKYTILILLLLSGSVKGQTKQGLVPATKNAFFLPAIGEWVDTIITSGTSIGWNTGHNIIFIPPGSVYYTITLPSSPASIYDTIPIMILGCDTIPEIVKQYGGKGFFDSKIYNSEVWWTTGYEVMELWHPIDLAVDMHGNSNYNQYRHIAYLDANKKPLKYFVWMSKQIP